jgi:beta-glucosidase/6-phospho-beta-glucosidase/beta-galactosidase
MTIQGLLSKLHTATAPPPLPESFLFGVATADHQCEPYDPDVEDIRDKWEREHGQTMRGRATDFRNRYQEDVDLARQLGCKMFRFSISWSRVEPAPGVFSKADFDFYQRLITAIRAAGMEPIVTLHHFVWPLHVEACGGMIAPDFPALYAGYVREVVKRLGQDLKYWITFNEPSQLIYGYIKPFWTEDYFVPPGLPAGATFDDQVAAVGALIRNLFLAHTRARQIIKAANPDALVGANPLVLGLPIWLQRFINWNATRLRSEADLGRQVKRLTGSSAPAETSPFKRGLASLLDALRKPYAIVSTMVAANWWHLGMAGKLPEFLCPGECGGQQDYVGLDYYWGISNLQLNRIAALINSGLGHFDQAPVWPAALYEHLKYQASLFPELPILIVENGCVDVADNMDRPTYLRKHIEQVQRARREGVNVAAYIVWAITSNREWGLHFDKASDFGLYHIELDSDPELRRVPTLSSLAYKTIITNNRT